MTQDEKRGPADEVHGHHRPQTVLDHLVRDRPPWLRSRVVRRAASAVAAAALVVAAVVALHPADSQRPPTSRLVGLGVQIPAPQAAGAPPRAIRATYRLAVARSGTRVELLGVSGPHLRGSEVRVRSAPAPDGSQIVTVAAVADCRSPSALEEATARYPVRVRRIGLDGTSARSLLRDPANFVDWAAAIRQDCWQRVAAAGVRVVGIVAGQQPLGRDALLDVRLASTLDRDVEVTAVDVADVSRIEPADSGVLPAGGARVVRVRLPVPDCALGPRPVGSGLLWSIGEVGDDAAATFVTALPPAADAALLAAAEDRCSPPGTTVRVTRSRLLPTDAVVPDRRSATIELRLRVRSNQPLVVLGTAPGPATTSDARLATSVSRVHPVEGSGRAVVVWHASCTAAPPSPLRLPVRLPRHGPDLVFAVTVDDPGLARMFSKACGLGIDGLVASGWRRPSS
jgi:hypothetical protein